MTKLNKTEQTLLNEIQSGVLVGRYQYYWRTGAGVLKSGADLTQRQANAVEKLAGYGLIVLSGGICTIPTIQDGVIAQQVGGEVLEVTADYAPVPEEMQAKFDYIWHRASAADAQYTDTWGQVYKMSQWDSSPREVTFTATTITPAGKVYVHRMGVSEDDKFAINHFAAVLGYWSAPEPTYTHMITCPDGRVIRVNDITPAPNGEEREDEAYTQGDAAATNADRLLTAQLQLLGGQVGVAMINEPLDVPARAVWQRVTQGVICTGIEAIYQSAWERHYGEVLGSGWQNVKPRVGMMAISTAQGKKEVPAVMVGEWGWQIDDKCITHLPTGRAAIKIPVTRWSESGRGEIAIIGMLMLACLNDGFTYPEENFLHGLKLAVGTLGRWYEMGRLPRIAYPARQVGTLKAKITRQAKAPKN